MAELNSTQQHALYIIPMVTGSLSFVASSIISYTILRSQKKLNMPYRRIMFGLSVLDVLQSLGVLTSIFPSPKGTATWAIGNTVSCAIQGYITTVGSTGVPLYLCSLCIYYICIIQFQFKASTFRIAIEPFLHIISIAYPIFCSIYFLVHGYYNNFGAICWVAPEPFACEIFPGVECTRGEGATRTRWMFLTSINVVSFVLICLIMTTLVCTTSAQVKRNCKYNNNFSPRSSPDDDADNSNNSSSTTTAWWSASLRSCSVVVAGHRSRLNNTRCSDKNTSSSNHHNSKKKRKNSVLDNQQRQVKLQAYSYIGCYLLTYGFIWSQYVYMFVAKKPGPFPLKCLTLIFFPLQGVFNILIYCRPHVVSLRKLCPDLFWFAAFVKVIQSGGDDTLTPEERQRRIMLLRRAATHNKTTVLQQPSHQQQEQDGALDVENRQRDNNNNGDSGMSHENEAATAEQ